MTRDFIFFLQTGFIKGTNFTKNELLNNHTIKKKDETTAFSFSILFVPVFESFYQFFFLPFHAPKRLPDEANLRRDWLPRPPLVARARFKPIWYAVDRAPARCNHVIWTPCRTPASQSKTSHTAAASVFFFFFLFGATGGRWRTGTTLDRRGRVNTRRCGPNDRRRPSFGEYQRGRGLERIVSIA